jgi:AMMECR1 domain-containing protein
LPQVWEQLPDKKEFLMHLCLKAGLSPDSWKKEKLVVSTYQVQAFEEEQAKQ